jgi:hypothetical protein
MDYTGLLVKSRNILIFEYFLVFILIIYGGNASEFTWALENWDNPIGFLLPILSVMVLGFIKGIRFNQKYLVLLLGYTLYFVASTILFQELHPRFFGIYIIKFTIVYVVVSGLGVRLFKIYDNILYYLCIIGIVFWLIMNIIPTSFIELLRNFEFSSQKTMSAVDFNTIIYTVGDFSLTTDYVMNFGGIQIFRNAGFAWEPGVFASFINLAIFFNLIRNRFKLKSNKHLWVFLIALASTFSTTGYSLFVLLALFYLYNQDFVKVFWLAPIVAVSVMFVFMLPFMYEKISFDNKWTTEELVYRSAKYNISHFPQRFQSLQIDFIDFMNHPLIGYGGHLEEAWTAKMGAKITTISGIGGLMSQFGIVGTLFFLISLWVSSKQIIVLFNVRGTMFPVLFILLYAISYSVFEILVMCVWLLYLSSFLKTEVIRRYIIHNIMHEKKD